MVTAAESALNQLLNLFTAFCLKKFFNLGRDDSMKVLLAIFYQITHCNRECQLKFSAHLSSQRVSTSVVWEMVGINFCQLLLLVVVDVDILFEISL